MLKICLRFWVRWEALLIWSECSTWAAALHSSAFLWTMAILFINFCSNSDLIFCIFTCTQYSSTRLLNDVRNCSGLIHVGYGYVKFGRVYMLLSTGQITPRHNRMMKRKLNMEYYTDMLSRGECLYFSVMAKSCNVIKEWWMVTMKLNVQSTDYA